VTPSHYRAYAHEHGPHGFTVVGSASINGTYEDAVQMAHDLRDRCPGARVGVFKSGTGREVISLPPRPRKSERMSETEALMKNYRDYQRDLPPWARGPG
jgi:hypothetical protein